MIDGECWRKDVGVVAVFAHITRLNVRQILACCVHTIVAVDATSGDVQMVEIGRQPPGGGMAVVASIPAVQVVEVFSAGGKPIVTGTAGSDDLQVIDSVCGRESSGVVAVFANNGGLDVRRVFTRCGCSVVAAHTVVENIRMIEVRGQPGGA